jgi:hypothetical protein
MIIHLFYTLNLSLLLSCLFVFRLKTDERRFSLSLVQALLGLLLLAGEYIYLAYHPEPYVVPVVLFSESSGTVCGSGCPFFRKFLCPYMVKHDPSVAKDNCCNRS